MFLVQLDDGDWVEVSKRSSGPGPLATMLALMTSSATKADEAVSPRFTASG